MFPRDMVCLRNTSVDNLHKGDTKDNNNNDDDDNNNNRQMLRSVIKSTTTTATTMRLLLLSFHYNSKIRGQEHYNMRQITSLLLRNSNNS